MPEFRFRICKKFQDCLSVSRQVSESVRIDQRVAVLNSKSVYSRNKLPRLTLEKDEWEKKAEERKEWNEKEKKRKWREGESMEETETGEETREKTTNETDNDREEDEEEDLMTETWREDKLRRRETEENKNIPTAKRKKRNDWREEDE